MNIRRKFISQVITRIFKIGLSMMAKLAWYVLTTNWHCQKWECQELCEEKKQRRGSFLTRQLIPVYHYTIYIKWINVSANRCWLKIPKVAATKWPSDYFKYWIRQLVLKTLLKCIWTVKPSNYWITFSFWRAWLMCSRHTYNKIKKSCFCQ